MASVLRYALVLSLLFFGSASPAAAQSYSTQKHVLDNGMTVLIREMPDNSMVSVHLLVKVGGAREGKFLGSGLTHFLEHMLFKSTENYGVGEIAQAVQAVGGRINASTGYDYTIYTIDVPAEKVETALGIVREMAFHAVFKEEEFRKEKEVVLNEMRLHEDNPDRVLFHLTARTVFLEHPYRHPVIGYRSLLTKLSVEQMREFYSIHYIPNNMVLSVAGNVRAGELFPKIEEAFSVYEREHKLPDTVNAEPQQITSRESREGYPTDLTRMSIAFPSVPLLHKDLFALDVLANALGDGKSSRLYQSLIEEEQIAFSTYAANYTPKDQGSFWISATLDGKNLDKAVEKINGIIRSVKEKGVKEHELDKVKKQMVADELFSLESTSSSAYAMATDQALAGDYDFTSKYIDAVSRVTNADIRRVANTYLVDERKNLIVLHPEREKAETGTENGAAADAPFQKAVLENGMTLLVKEERGLPIVSLHLAMNGGTRLEEDDKAGISNLTAKTWVKATKSKSAQELARYVEERGMRLSGFSGQNSFGLSFEFLSEDSGDAISIFFELLESPAFRKEDLETNKALIVSAIKNRKDDIFDYTFHELRRTLFEGHPYQRDPLGTVESVGRITADDTKDFYRSWSDPGNMVLTLVGDVDAQEVAGLIKRRMVEKKSRKVSLPEHTIGTISEPSRKRIELNKKQAMIMVGFRGPTVFSEDRNAMEVATAVLGSSFSGRLFQSVREELGKAYTMGGFMTPGLDTGGVIFYVLTDKESLSTAEKIVRREVEKLRGEKVPKKELGDIKTYLKGRHMASRERNSSVSFSAALDELYGLGYAYSQEYEERIEAVTSSDVQAAAKKYLDLTSSVTVVTEPVEM